MPFSLMRAQPGKTKSVRIGALHLPAFLLTPREASALVVFAHDRKSSRLSLRNRSLALAFNRVGIATLLIDLLCLDEEAQPDQVGEADIVCIADQLMDAVAWTDSVFKTQPLLIGLFGAGYGASAALVTAAQTSRISAVVSADARLDLIGERLKSLRAPTLFIVDDESPSLMEASRRALARIPCDTSLEFVSHANSYTARGDIERITQLAAAWFERYLTTSRA